MKKQLNFNKGYLAFYNKCMKDPMMMMPGRGLCLSIPKRLTEKQYKVKDGLWGNPIKIELIDFFAPTSSDVLYTNTDKAFWGNMDTYPDLLQRRKHFNTFRQTIILFCAAMNGEKL